MDAIYTLYVWLGIYSGWQSSILTLSRFLEKYSVIVLSMNALALALGLFGLFVSNKKKFPLSAIILCLLVFTPLAAMHIIYIRPPNAR